MKDNNVVFSICMWRSLVKHNKTQVVAMVPCPPPACCYDMWSCAGKGLDWEWKKILSIPYKYGQDFDYVIDFVWFFVFRVV